ncbi:LacI family DNA-binding transcriptional regulator [Amycolatopsis sp. NPDC051372]|uniref:LacI family DNA-binding transcriptional regulator n=1 Tax=Amycolatopsis sp. NPDC051372 TaxID=3155669 RepID=UPI00342A76B2
MSAQDEDTTGRARGRGARVTLAQVAVRAGVSRSTASLVLRNSELVAPRTRQAVQDAMAALGYVYHRGAASLRVRQSGSIAVVVTDLANPFHAELTDGVEAALRPSGGITLLARTFGDVRRQTTVLTTMLEYQTDGVLLVPATGTQEDDLTVLTDRGIPLVLMTRYIGKPGLNYVGVQETEAGHAGATHLLDHGCAAMAYFGGPEKATARRDRFSGFRSALAGSTASVLERWSIPTPNTALGSYEVAARLLAAGLPLPDGVLAHSDAVAFGLMRALRETGRRPPQDMRIVGGADIEAAAMWEPPLTTISVHAADMGRKAADLLRRIIDGNPADGPHLYPPALMIRESCGCGPQHRR